MIVTKNNCFTKRDQCNDKTLLKNKKLFVSFVTYRIRNNYNQCSGESVEEAKFELHFHYLEISLQKHVEF